jgi:hypothetical protein
MEVIIEKNWIYLQGGYQSQDLKPVLGAEGGHCFMWNRDNTVSSVVWPGWWTRLLWNELNMRMIMEAESRDAHLQLSVVMRWVSEAERG